MKPLLFAGALLLAGLCGCAMMKAESEKNIPLGQVPETACRAAARKVEGIKFTGAEVEQEKGQEVYELKGAANGTQYEIEVTADGNVLEVEEKRAGDKD